MIPPRLPLPVLCFLLLAACSKEHGASSTPPPAAGPAKPQSATVAEAPSAAAPAPAPPAANPAPPPQAAAAPAQAIDGEPIVRGVCMACHQAGMNGAPRFADKIAWKPRIAQGRDTLYQHAMKGLRGMPPRGGNPNLSDDQIKAAVDYMVKAAGGYTN